MRDGRTGFDPVHLYEYLVKARAKLLDCVRQLTPAQYTQEFPFGLKTVRDTVVEIPLAAWTYIRRMRGDEVRPWVDRPSCRFYTTHCHPLLRSYTEHASDKGP